MSSYTKRRLLRKKQPVYDASGDESSNFETLAVCDIICFQGGPS